VVRLLSAGDARAIARLALSRARVCDFVLGKAVARQVLDVCLAHWPRQFALGLEGFFFAPSRPLLADAAERSSPPEGIFRRLAGFARPGAGKHFAKLGGFRMLRVQEESEH